MDKPGVRIHPGITALVRQLYAEEPDEGRWLDGILDAAGEALGQPQGLSLTTLHVTPEGRATVGRTAGFLHPSMTSFLESGTADTDRFAERIPEVIRRLYRSGPLSWGSDGIAATGSPSMRATFDALMGEVGVVDGLGLIGMDPSGHALVLAFGVPSRRLPPSTRMALARLAGQLATAYRLRRVPTAPAALLEPRTGEVLEHRALEAASQRELRGAAAAVERAQRHAGSDPEEALGFWKALVEGRWSLVERFESDGRRILVACQNEPETHAHRALTEDERKVVALVSLSHSQKLVAYELGYSEVVVSRLIKSALGKLGLRSRSQLIELRGALGELS